MRSGFMKENLRGIKVLDISHLISGSFCTMTLGDLGAEVIKLEPPGGEECRKFGPPFINGESGVFLSINRNKESITLNLKKDEGKTLFYKIIKGFDVLVENYRYGVTEKLKIDYDTIKKINDKIIYCSIKSFPSYKPLRDKIGVDPIFQAMSGTMSVTGEEGGPPIKVGIPIVDMSTGLYATIAILVALRNREKTGRGSEINLNLFDVIISLQATMASIYFATGKNPEKLGTGHHFSSPSQAFKTKDDKYIIVSAYNQKFWLELCKILKIEHLITDKKFINDGNRLKNRRELGNIIQSIIRKKKEKEWLGIFEGANIPYAPILKYSDVFREGGYVYKDRVIEVNHSKAKKIRILRSPIELKGDSNVRLTPPPILGAHNYEFYSAIGFTKDKVNLYKRRGII
jgi:crotonobetainyl-CoA:carnitine CoA-transferase CaiB-like acyl-CoA transferase